MTDGRNGPDRERQGNGTAPHPRRRSTDRVDANRIFASGGEMGKVIAATDWSKSPLGPIEFWSPDLRTTVSLALASSFPINIVWGPGHVQIYNDGYRPICGAIHPMSMGQDFRECWAAAMPSIGRVWTGGGALSPGHRDHAASAQREASSRTP